MFTKILYYFDRVSIFWWVCAAFVFIFTAIHSRNSYRENKLKKSQAISRTLFVPYILLILVFTVFIRLPNNFFGYELVPFWSYREILGGGDRELLFENISNIIIFIPFGVLFPLSGFKRSENGSEFKTTVISGFLFSIFIEIIQLVTKFGYFEFDDIFHNTAGVLIGVLVLFTAKSFLRKRES